jgi:hypothetical protein
MRPSRPGYDGWRVIAAVFLATMFWSGSAHAFQKTDVIILRNGDRITGEIKKYERGKLRLSTSGMSTVYIEWPHIASIRSDKMLEVELDTGQRMFGNLHPTEDETKIIVQTQLATAVVEQVDIVEVTPIKEGFWDKIDGSIDFGSTITQANSQVDYNLNATATRRTLMNTFTADVTSFIRTQEEVQNTNRQDLSFTYRRQLRGRWFAMSVTSLQKNNELNLDFRGTLGGGAGNTLLHSNRVILALAGGAVYTREKFTGNEDQQNNLEALTAISVQWFTFGDKETDLDTRFTVLPSMSSWGRVRIELTSTFRREILFKDLYFAVNFFENYDSDPPQQEGEAHKNDFGITTSLGWKF